MMYELITMQEVTTPAYPLQYPSSPSTSLEEMDRKDLLVSVISNMMRQQNLRRGFYRSLMSAFETDFSSIRPHFEIKNETTLFEERTEVEKFMEDNLEYDIIVHLPPTRERIVKVKVKSIENAELRVVEPEGI